MAREVEEILQQFPFSRWNDQSQKLAAVLLQFPEPTQTAIENSGVSKPTYYRIRDAYTDLTHEEKTRLVQYLAEHVDKVEP